VPKLQVTITFVMDVELKSYPEGFDLEKVAESVSKALDEGDLDLELLMDSSEKIVTKVEPFKDL